MMQLNNDSYAEIMTGDPRWHNILMGVSLLKFFFAGVDQWGTLLGLQKPRLNLIGRKAQGWNAVKDH